uniref:Uncharacterized protein n=1 Tax=Chrysotila carterae TaxID=13221 RepID=A0A7S4F9M0_CHRCT|mmetsp:Transcript_7182/g.15890  ORF Transcript_7182/g.15890 Transcript_7182/m.15890 type:complete len:241 (+) Transcript_7182:438-1160(+)|eukprot:1037031-Pleurochrysis_carterae.AAC.5
MRLVDPSRVRWDMLKRTLGLGAACAFLTLTSLSLLNVVGLALNPPLLLRTVWNLLFGLLMLSLQLGCAERRISTYFGFLDGRFGRGLFYLFVGNNGLVSEGERFSPLSILSYAVWAACWLVGCIELCGPRSHLVSQDGNTNVNGGGGVTATGCASPLCAAQHGVNAEPSLTVNGCTISVDGGAAQASAHGARTIWQHAIAAGGGGSGGGLGVGGSGDGAGAGGPAAVVSDNPFRPYGSRS